jgi:hypothetical protein
VVQVVEHLSSKQKTQGQTPVLPKKRPKPSVLGRKNQVLDVTFSELNLNHFRKQILEEVSEKLKVFCRKVNPV